VAQHLEAILQNLRNLEPLPQVAVRVMELARRDGVVPRELAQVIQTDVALTAKILRLCNAAYFGFRRKIGALDEAAVRLGNRTLTNLVLTSCTGEWFRDLGASTEESRERLWRLSVTNALAANLLARMAGDIDPHRAYTVGLLQNLGHVVLDRWLLKERAAIEERTRRGKPQIVAEREVLGVDHAEVGAMLAERWYLPSQLVDAIRHHHAPAKAGEGSELATVAGLGEEITLALEEQDGVEALKLIGVELESLSGLPPLEILETLREEVDQARELVANG
jgi:HD-like signal output (HDOD) protein